MACLRRIAVVVTVALVVADTSAALAQPRQAAREQSPPAPDTASEPTGFVTEPEGIRRAAIFADRHMSKGELGHGFYPDIKSMIPGSGWLGGGPGYRHWYAKDRAMVDASAGISWRGYKTAQARVEFRKLAKSRLTAGSQIRWQDFTQVAFYGEGTNTRKSDLSEYRLRSTNIAGYAVLRPLEWIGIGAKVGWLKPEVLPRSGSFMRDRPDTREMFPSNLVFRFPDQSFVHSEASVTADTRDFPGHPMRGTLVRAAAANFSDRDSGLFSFRRYEAEGAQFVPLAGSRIVIALRGWLVASDTSNGRVVPFYLAPSLGGRNSLRGYAEYRFHDRHLLLVNVETRVALMTHLDAAFLFDAGNVAARVDDLNLDRRSYGAGLRLHTRRTTFARLDVARGGEGWRAVFSLSDPLNLARVSRQTAPAPFVP